MLYRLLTEDKNRSDIIKIIGRFFESFTLLSAVGYWRGQAEQSLIIEIDATSLDVPNVRERVEAIAEEICTSNNQECVLQQSWMVESDIIS